MGDDLLVAILAAGASRRLGQPKQLVSIDQQPLLRRQCRTAGEARIGPVAAVLGCHAEACRAAIADLPVSLLQNDQWEEGIASSIRVASRAAQEMGAAGLLIFHADQYRITARDLQSLHEAWTAAGKAKACRSRHDDYCGPPVILPAMCFDAAMRIEGDQGAREVLASLGRDLLIDVPMPAARDDLDLPEQLPLVSAYTLSKAPSI